MDAMDILTFRFDPEGRQRLKGDPSGTDWPVVYMIHDDDEAYIGETSSMVERMTQHLQNPERVGLEELEVIVDHRFNKSAILDLEQTLIRHCGADGRFRLQNRSRGQSSSHGYYQREMYMAMVPDIWRMMLDRGLARRDLDELRNSILFKYSPYIALTREQWDVAGQVLQDISESLLSGTGGVSVVHGSAGTGKTVLATSLMFNMANCDSYGPLDDGPSVDICRYASEHGGLRIGLVVPMTSLRQTLRKVYKGTGNGLRADMVMGPNDVVGRMFDVLIVDESHRLAQRRNIANMGSFDCCCRELGLDPHRSTQLDWVLRSCRHCVLFYDGDQTVKGSDISPSQFDSSIDVRRTDYTLTTQLRCLAGDGYADYLKRVFDCSQPYRQEMDGYDLRMFDDVGEMVDEIHRLDDVMGLCRTVAGYSWKWVSKGLSREEIERDHKEDIVIDGHRYIWNMSNKEWILRPGSVDEVGCIHTTQGYDLNYVAVIFGEEVDYDGTSGRIVVDLDRFHDTNVKNGTDPEKVREYILNSYRVMMARGIKGCFVYACNRGLREYLRMFL